MVGLRKLVPVVAMLWLAPTHAAELAPSALDAERAKQESIYHAHGEQRDKGYTVDRPLSYYSDGFPAEFLRVFGRLGAQDRWLDIGAGEGQAVLDYYASASDAAQVKTALGVSKAQAIAMSIEDRRSALWYRTAAKLPFNQIQYLSGKRLSEYSPAELGQFDVITDMMGGFSYATDLSLFMRKVLDLLEVNGSFFTVLQDIRREDGSNTPYYDGASFLTEIVDADGSELKVCAWLKRIGCVEVVCEPKAHWKPPLEAFRIRKVCNAVTVPPLTPVHYQAGTPPERRFRLAPGELGGSVTTVR
jgi:SAM-dependent methyltransferase